MSSLGVVFVASLIGAKTLGEDVRAGLVYANVGLGILEGIDMLYNDH